MKNGNFNITVTGEELQELLLSLLNVEQAWKKAADLETIFPKKVLILGQAHKV